jgi:uncharacterized protein YbbK (DUF523 family)
MDLAGNMLTTAFFFGDTEQQKPAVMVSACLLGEPVRYDGADKYQAWVPQLAEQLELISCCPEVAAGLAVPRPPVQLVAADHGLLARGRDDHALDATEALTGFSQQSLAQRPARLCGYVFKSRSPSCGLGSTPLFNEQGQPISTGSGIQAEAYQRQLPHLIFRQETDLDSDIACQRFIRHCRILWEAQRCKPQQQPAFLAHYGWQWKDEKLFLLTVKAGLEGDLGSDP